jgi:hypothetical protein
MTHFAAPPRTRRTRRLAYAAVAFLLVVLFVGGAMPPAPPAPPPRAPAPAVPPADAEALREPLRLVAEARRAWADVDDYTGVLVQQERVGGRLQPEQTMTMKLRKEPFSVRLRWSAPAAMAKQDVIYVAGRHNGMMRVRPAGLLGALGFVSVDPHDPRTRDHSNHTITEAGLGHLVERLAREWEAARAHPPQVSVADAEFDGRPCVRVEAVGGAGAWYRSVQLFDKETHLPVRTESRGRPREGAPDGDLLEADAYRQLRLNVGLTDADFAD